MLVYFLTGSTAQAQVKEVRRVLIFNEVGPAAPAVDLVKQGITQAFAGAPYKIELYFEYLETSLFPAQADQQEFQQWYINKYRNRRLDLIIAVGPSPLRFLIAAHERYFHGVPVVFCSTTEESAGRPKLGAEFTGVWARAEPAQTLAAALQLAPDTKHVAVIGGTDPYDEYLENEVRERLRDYESKLDFIYLTNLTMPQLLDQVHHLPDHTVILFTSLLRDASGTQYISATESAPMVVQVSNAPVFTLSDAEFGHGEVGGDIFSFANEGKQVGEVARKIVEGHRPQDIPITTEMDTYMFDWRALQRWGLKESNLPPGSLIVNRPQSFWESYKRDVIGAISMILVEALLIFGLLWQRRRRARAEGELRESEVRFRSVADTAPVLIWMSGADKLCTYFNKPWLDFTGRSMDEEIGNGWNKGIHPQDSQRSLEIYNQAFDHREAFQMEYRLRRRDGAYRWIFDQGVPRFNTDGSFVGYIGSAIDVTERKLAEEAISTVSQRLIEAQEQERSRLARELHDDINQRIALVAVLLDSLKQGLSTASAELREGVGEATKQIADLGSDIQALSHQLHSSKLEYLGLAKAATSFCREVSERQGVTIDLRCETVPQTLPNQISLTFFRVLQESLQNAIKHSGTRHFQVWLTGDANRVELTVHDSGVGFRPEEAFKGRGLGLTSMQERLKLVGGGLSIDSTRQQGTTIHAWVPLSSRMTGHDADDDSIRSSPARERKTDSRDY